MPKSRNVIAASTEDLDESPAFLCRNASRLFRKAMQIRLQRSGIGIPQWFCLRVLWNEDNLTQRELCARAGLAEPAAVGALTGLERAGLSTRVRHATDRRKVIVRLTPKGKALRMALMPNARDINAIAVKGVSAADLQALQRTMHRVIANLEQLVKDAGDAED